MTLSISLIEDYTVFMESAYSCFS